MKKSTKSVSHINLSLHELKSLNRNNTCGLYIDSVVNDVHLRHWVCGSVLVCFIVQEYQRR